MRNYFLALLMLAVVYASPIVSLAQDDDDDESRPGLILVQEVDGHTSRRLVGQVDVPFAQGSTKPGPSSGSQTWTGSLLLKSEDGKGSVAIGVTDDLTGKYSAAELVKLATQALGGQGGGGRPDMAQGGGPDGSKSAEAIAAVRAAL